jgi:hypothetical protein
VTTAQFVPREDEIAQDTPWNWNRDAWRPSDRPALQNRADAKTTTGLILLANGSIGSVSLVHSSKYANRADGRESHAHHARRTAQTTWAGVVVALWAILLANGQRAAAVYRISAVPEPTP